VIFAEITENECVSVTEIEAKSRCIISVILLTDTQSVVSVELFLHGLTRNMQTPCRKSVHQVWMRELMLMLMLINSIYPRANLVTKVTTAAP